VFLFNQGDKQGAAAKLLNFRKYFEIVLGKRRDIDPEVFIRIFFSFFDLKLKLFSLNEKLQEISSKLGPILNLGEMKPTPTPSPAKTTTDPSSNETKNSDPQASAQKYLNISKPTDETGEAYNRESTVASVSGMHLDRANSTASALGSYSRQQTEIMKNSFE